MSGDLQSHYGKAQRETAQLLGYDLACLAPDQSLRLDCAVALRLALDDLQGRIVRRESIDVNRMLTAAEALGRILPPAVLASPPEVNAPDPRDFMWATYKQKRDRGALHGEGYDGKVKQVAALQGEVEQLKAEIERLKAGASAPGESTLASPLPDNVVALPRATAGLSAAATPPRPAPPQYELAPPEPWRGFTHLFE
jgi:hypothetical protein